MLPPFILHEPAEQTSPLVFTSSHSGRHYPPDFLAAARLDPLSLRRSEDGFVDELFAAAPASGAPLLAATFARAFCDANREAWELDPEMFDGALPPWVNTSSTRVHAGLGTIARVVSSGEGIYHQKLSFGEAERRIREFWQPWHAQLARPGCANDSSVRRLLADRLSFHADLRKRCAWPRGGTVRIG